MTTLSVLRALGPIDAANVRRDPFLRWMLVFPPLFAMLFRWAAALLEPWLATRIGIDLALYHPLLGSALVLLTPMLFGCVVGFLLLDQKDDGTLTALRVTPLTPSGYLAYRITIPVALSVVMTPLVLELGGFTSAGLGARILAGIAAAPLAPAFALFLAAFARNKVQGFALMKAAGVINWPPILAWFTTSSWQLAYGLCPTYWPVKVYWELEAGSTAAWIYFLVDLVVLSLLVAWLARRFERSATA
jgi:fluoroquinolone transport system permease protein